MTTTMMTKQYGAKRTAAKKAGVKRISAKKPAVKKTAARRGAAVTEEEQSFPGALVTLDGKEYFLVSKEEFEEWDEDRQLLALVMERLADSDEDALIPAEEVDRHFDELKKKRS